VQKSPGKRSGTSALRGRGRGRGDDALQAKGELGASDPHAAAARGVSGSATDLPFLGAIQTSFGRYDVSGVDAHTDGAAQGACGELGASAYATGDQIAFAGTPDLHTAAHEAAHVVQQRAGVHLAGGVGREGDPYEQHADAVADAVVAGRSAEPLLARMAGPAAATSAGAGAPAAGAIQRRAQPEGLTAAPNAEDKLRFLSGLSMQDILDTLAAPAARPLLPDLLANEGVAPVGGVDRLGAALRASAGTIDAAFWMKFGRMHVTHPGDVPVIEAKVGKKNMSAERRMGTISSSVIAQLRSTDLDVNQEAFLYLNGLNMHDILDVLVMVQGAGLLDTNFTSLASAAPIHVKRLMLAAHAVDEVTRLVAVADIESKYAADWTLLGPDGDTIKQWVEASPQAKLKNVLGDDELIRDGQFQLQVRIYEALAALKPKAGALEAQYQSLIDSAARVDLASLNASAAAFRASMSASGISDPDLLAATGPYARMMGDEKTTGDAMFAEWWGKYQKTKSAPPVTPYVNIFALHAHHSRALIQCGAHTGQVAQLYQNARKASGESKDPKASFSAQLATSIKREWTLVPGTTNLCRGDVLQYGGNLADSVARMKAALDGGWVLHIRVVSGGGARTPHPQPVGPRVVPPAAPADPTEHSLLIVGYRGNGFIVSDSDPHGEGKPALETGFTTIYFDAGANRLSTAVDDTGFPVVCGDDGRGGSELGDFQADGHHRYQVWSAFSV